MRISRQSAENLRGAVTVEIREWEGLGIGLFWRAGHAWGVVNAGSGPMLYTGKDEARRAIRRLNPDCRIVDRDVTVEATQE